MVKNNQKLFGHFHENLPKTLNRILQIVRKYYFEKEVQTFKEYLSQPHLLH